MKPRIREQRLKPQHPAQRRPLRLGHGAQDAPISFDDLPQGKVLALNLVRSSCSIVHSQFLRRQIIPQPQLEIESLSALIQALRADLGCSILARATWPMILLRAAFMPARSSIPN